MGNLSADEPEAHRWSATHLGGWGWFRVGFAPWTRSRVPGAHPFLNTVGLPTAPALRGGPSHPGRIPPDPDLPSAFIGVHRWTKNLSRHAPSH